MPSLNKKRRETFIGVRKVFPAPSMVSLFFLFFYGFGHPLKGISLKQSVQHFSLVETVHKGLKKSTREPSSTF